MEQITNTPADPPTLATRVARHASTRNWQEIMIAWIGCTLALYAIAVVVALDRGIPALIERDTGVSARVWPLIFMFGFGHYLRGLRPRYALLTSLVGSALYTLATAHYVGRGVIGLSTLAAHGGIFLVSYLAIAALAQDRQPGPHRFRFHHMLMPAISLVLLTYMAGLGTPSGVAGWIITRLGPLPLYLLALWFAVGAGYVIHNHINASGLFVALVCQFLYMVAAMAYFVVTPGLPLVIIGSHVSLAVTTTLVIFLQTQEQI